MPHRSRARARRLHLVLVPVAFLQGSIGEVGAKEPVQPGPEDGVVVEYADVLMSPAPDGPRLEGYLVIWNGTDEPVSITGVRGGAFERIDLVQTVRTKGETQAIVRERLSIPPDAELLMRPGGVFLSIHPAEALPDVGDQAILEVLYADGSSEEVSTRIRPQGSVLDDHHHGMSPTGRL